MRLAVLALCCGLAAATAAPAQDSETLADIRQDLSLLKGELLRLQQELNTTGTSGVQVSGSTLDRVNIIETELQRVTALAEELQHRVDVVVQDGSNRIGDLDPYALQLVCDREGITLDRALGKEVRIAGPIPVIAEGCPRPDCESDGGGNDGRQGARPSTTYDRFPTLAVDRADQGHRKPGQCVGADSLPRETEQSVSVQCDEPDCAGNRYGGKEEIFGAVYDAPGR